MLLRYPRLAIATRDLLFQPRHFVAAHRPGLEGVKAFSLGSWLGSRAHFGQIPSALPDGIAAPQAGQVFELLLPASVTGGLLRFCLGIVSRSIVDPLEHAWQLAGLGQGMEGIECFLEPLLTLRVGPALVLAVEVGKADH